MNYFEFFQIPVSFQVDESALRRIFYQNSKKYHPDFHTQASDAQQADMLEMAALNTNAYQTLSDPDRRMRYVLEINGLLDDERKLQLPQEFLMAMMTINETLMELEFDFDRHQYEQALHTVSELDAGLNAGIQPILDTTPVSPAQLQAVLDYYLKKRYLLRIQENLSKFAAL